MPPLRAIAIPWQRCSSRLVFQERFGCFSSWNLEQIFLELRQLTGTPQTFRIDQIGHVGLCISMFADMNIEHELSQCAMQVRKRACQQAEAGAADLGSSGKIQQSQSLAYAHMIGRAEIKCGWSSPTSHFPVIRFASALRHAAVRQVGYLQQDVLQRSLYLIQPGFRLLQLITQMSDLYE